MPAWAGPGPWSGRGERLLPEAGDAQPVRQARRRWAALLDARHALVVIIVEIEVGLGDARHVFHVEPGQLFLCPAARRAALASAVCSRFASCRRGGDGVHLRRLARAPACPLPLGDYPCSGPGTDPEPPFQPLSHAQKDKSVDPGRYYYSCTLDSLGGHRSSTKASFRPSSALDSLPIPTSYHTHTTSGPCAQREV